MSASLRGLVADDDVRYGVLARRSLTSLHRTVPSAGGTARVGVALPERTRMVGRVVAPHGAGGVVVVARAVFTGATSPASGEP